MVSKTSRTVIAPALRSRILPQNSPRENLQVGSSGDETGLKRLGGLVLTRRLGESIMIGNAVEVQIVTLKTGSVRIKIVAPRSIAVHRREVFDAIQANPPVVEAAPSRTETVIERSNEKPGGLVLTRSVEESIMIGDEVEIKVVEVRPSTVKLRVSAPKTVAVHRREVFDSIRDSQS